jgi:Fur family iron response transcriptional regulator
MQDIVKILRDHGVSPTPQRIAVAHSVLYTKEHPSADDIWGIVKESWPTLSRTTVYNTLNLLVEKGILKSKVIRVGKTVYDPCVERHHHFIDERTGEIHDIPWDSIKVTGVDALKDFEVLEYHVVVRGRKKR